MSEVINKLITRITQKSDISSNWENIQETFVPLLGEIIHYSDLNKIKIGNGETALKDLDFLAAGKGTIADQYNMTAVGMYNTVGNSRALFVVGNGTDVNNRKDALVVKQDGSVLVQKNPATDLEVATKSYVDSKIPTPTAADVNKVLTANNDSTYSWSEATVPNSINKALTIIPNSEYKYSFGNSLEIGGYAGEIKMASSDIEPGRITLSYGIDATFTHDQLILNRNDGTPAVSITWEELINLKTTVSTLTTEIENLKVQLAEISGGNSTN